MVWVEFRGIGTTVRVITEAVLDEMTETEEIEDGGAVVGMVRVR